MKKQKTLLLSTFMVLSISHSWAQESTLIRKLQAPSYWSFFTNDIFELKNSPYQLFEKYFYEYGQKGEPIQLWIPMIKNIFIFSHPDDLKEIFRLERDGVLKKGAIINDVQKYLLGDGVAALEQGELYKELLHFYAPKFQPKKIKEHTEVITRWTDEFISYIELNAKQNNDEYQDMEQLSLIFTMGVICRTMFGYEISPEESDAIGKEVNVILNFIQYKMLNRPFVLPDFLPTPGNNQYHSALAALDKFIDKIWKLDEKRSEESELFITLIRNSNFEESTKRNQLKNIFFGGHETTAHLVVMALYRLTNHPKVKKKLYDELQNDKETPYLDAFINETLRLDSPISIYGRETLESVQVNGMDIPAGSTLLFSQHNAHRLEEFWDTPLEFNPERFLTKKKRPLQSFFPFGLGSRKCVGKYLSLLETKIFITQFMQKERNWRLRENWIPKVKLQCTSRIEGGVPMNCKTEN